MPSAEIIRRMRSLSASLSEIWAVNREFEDCHSFKVLIREGQL